MILRMTSTMIWMMIWAMISTNTTAVVKCTTVRVEIMVSLRTDVTTVTAMDIHTENHAIRFLIKSGEKYMPTNAIIKTVITKRECVEICHQLRWIISTDAAMMIMTMTRFMTTILAEVVHQLAALLKKFHRFTSNISVTPDRIMKNTTVKQQRKITLRPTGML